MSKKLVKCDFCEMAIPTGKCELAVYRKVIEGKEYTFCCKICAQEYKPAKKSSRKK